MVAACQKEGGWWLVVGESTSDFAGSLRSHSQVHVPLHCLGSAPTPRGQVILCPHIQLKPTGFVSSAAKILDSLNESLSTVGIKKSPYLQELCLIKPAWMDGKSRRRDRLFRHWMRPRYQHRTRGPSWASGRATRVRLPQWPHGAHQFSAPPWVRSNDSGWGLRHRRVWARSWHLEGGKGLHRLLQSF